MVQYDKLPPLKRQVKDSVFTDLFGNPTYLLELYHELHPEDTTATVDDLATVTLQNVLVDAPYNDLGFVVGDRLMVLIESQSTWTPNIAIRALLYLAKTLDMWLREHRCNLYSSSKVAFPKPELYVVYTGDAHVVPQIVSIAEDFFPNADCAVDARVRVLQGGGILGEYVEFAKIATEQARLHGRTGKAAAETVRICQERGLLAPYLESRKQEVQDIMITLYDEQDIMDRYLRERREQDRASGRAEGHAEGHAEGRAEGRAEGILETRVKDVRNLMSSLGFAADKAMDVLGIVGDERVACMQALSQ